MLLDERYSTKFLYFCVFLRNFPNVIHPTGINTENREKKEEKRTLQKEKKENFKQFIFTIKE